MIEPGINDATCSTVHEHKIGIKAGPERTMYVYTIVLQTADSMAKEVKRKAKVERGGRASHLGRAGQHDKDARYRPSCLQTSPLNFLRGSTGGLLGLGGLGGQELGVDLGQDTTLGDGDTAEELVQLFVVSDGELQVSGDDSRLLVVSGGVTGQFEDFGRQVFEDG